MGTFKDLSGQKFNRLTVIKRVPKPEHLKRNCVYWLCKCDCGGETILATSEITKGGTKSCGCLSIEFFKNYYKENRKWKYNIGNIVCNKNSDGITITEQIFDEQKKYKYRCNKCGYDKGIIKECNLNLGGGCACCADKVLIQGINDIPSIEPWMVKYFIGGDKEAQQYMRTTNKRILMTCPLCNNSKYNDISDLYYKHHIGCSCGDGKSYPKKFMACVLDQLEIEYEWGFRREWLRMNKDDKRTKEFDFYLPNYRIIIEIDGGLGHGNIPRAKWCKSAEETKKVDDWKDDQAKLNGLSVIRILADDSNVGCLSNNIIAQLGNVFNLEKVNWEQCDKFATKNIVKEVADYFELNKPLLTSKIADIFHISRCTVKNYLKKAKQLGWCSYDPQESKKFGTGQTWKMLSKESD